MNFTIVSRIIVHVGLKFCCRCIDVNSFAANKIMSTCKNFSFIFSLLMHFECKISTQTLKHTDDIENTFHRLSELFQVHGQSENFACLIGRFSCIAHKSQREREREKDGERKFKIVRRLRNVFSVINIESLDRSGVCNASCCLTIIFLAISIKGQIVPSRLRQAILCLESFNSR